MIRETLAVVAMVPQIERWRTSQSLPEAIRRARELGRKRAPRTSTDALWRAIYAVDKRLFRRPNCVRRCLLAMSLDRGLADLPFTIGIDLLPGQSPDQARLQVIADGHAWVADARGRERPYDVEIPLP